MTVLFGLFTAINVNWMFPYMYMFYPSLYLIFDGVNLGYNELRANNSLLIYAEKELLGIRNCIIISNMKSITTEILKWQLNRKDSESLICY